jgi:hypothetical protein
VLHFFSLFTAPANVKKLFWNDRKVCHTHTNALSWNYEKFPFVFTQIFSCWNKKFRLIDDSRKRSLKMMWQKIHWTAVFSSRSCKCAFVRRSTLKNEVCLFQFQGSFRLCLLDFTPAHVEEEKKATRVTLTAHANYLISDVFSDAVTQYRGELNWKKYSFRACMWKLKLFFLSSCTFFFRSFAFACKCGRTNQNCGTKHSSRSIKVNLECIALW